MRRDYGSVPRSALASSGDYPDAGVLYPTQEITQMQECFTQLRRLHRCRSASPNSGDYTDAGVLYPTLECTLQEN